MNSVSSATYDEFAAIGKKDVLGCNRYGQTARPASGAERATHSQREAAMRYAIAFFLLATGAAGADVYTCQAGSEWSDDAEVVLLAAVNEDGRSGTVKVDGVSHRARVTMEGIDRRWDFDLGSNYVYQYAFVISPDGIARYYDFSGKGPGQTVTPAQTFVCR